MTATLPAARLIPTGPSRPWSDRTRRAMLPALIAACYAGDADRAADLCRTEEVDPGLTGAVSTDPTDRRH